jgi:hypothetical protein
LERDTTNETTTNKSGNYTQRYLITGKYQVPIEAPGFRTAVNEDVSVSVDANACVDCPGVAGRIFNAIGNYVSRQW